MVRSRPGSCTDSESARDRFNNDSSGQDQARDPPGSGRGSCGRAGEEQLRYHSSPAWRRFSDVDEHLLDSCGL